MTRQLRVAVVSGLLLLSSVAMIQSARAQNTRPPKNIPVSDQATNIPYYTLKDGMSSKLALNNVAPTPTKVTVTIFNADGQAHVLDPIILDAHSFKEIQLAEVVPQGFESGNIEVAFNGISMAVTCQVGVFSLEKRVSFESREQDMMDFESANLAGIMFLPKGADGFLAVTNVAKNRVTVQLTAGSLKQTVALFPRETHLFKLNDDESSPATTLVKLQHNGLPGDLITTGYVLGLKDGYSSGIAMVDPGIMRSSRLAGAHFRAGQADASEGFPAGTRFHSPLLLANVSANPVVAHVSVDYTVDDSQGSEGNGNDAGKNSASTLKDAVVKVKDLTIAPGDVQRVELSDTLGGVGKIAEAGVDIAYDAAPGSVIGQLTSVDQTGDYAFEVPVKDPEAMNEMMESIYPWTLENGMATVLHLKNTTNETQKAGALIRFEGGVYNPGKIELQPYQSVAINIQKLKDSKKPDVLGRVFPTSATHGQLAWFQETPYTMIGRAEGTDVAAGIARSFSCNALCCINFWIDYTLSPNPMNGLVGSSGQFAAEEEESDCSGTYWDYPNVQSTASSWTSSATSKATVNSMGSATFVGGGSATITANFSNLNWFINPSSGLCFRQNYNYTATAPVNVCIPASVRIVQDVIASVSGTQLVYNNCSNSYENEGGATWGNTHCYTFQLVDSCGHDITTDNYLAVEHRSPFSMNPNNQSVQNSTTTITNGRWVDWMTYLYTQSPGVPSGWFLKVNQVIHIVNQLTGRDDAVATYCQ